MIRAKIAGAPSEMGAMAEASVVAAAGQPPGISLPGGPAVRAGRARRVALVLRALPLVVLLGVSACGAWDGKREAADQQVRLSGVFLASGAADAALYAADEALVRQPGYAAALEARGNALAAMGRNEEAQQAYLQAIAASPSAVSARLALGRLLIQINPQMAEATLNEVLARQPRNVAALSNIGVARDLQGRHADAQQAYRAALGADPKNTGASVNLGLSLVLSGNNVEAIAVLRPLAEGPNPNEAVLENLAAALAATGQTAEAERVMARVGAPGQAVAPTVAQAPARPAPPPPRAPEPAPATIAAAPPIPAPAATPMPMADAQPIAPRVEPPSIPAAVAAVPVPTAVESQPAVVAAAPPPPPQTPSLEPSAPMSPGPSVPGSAETVPAIQTAGATEPGAARWATHAQLGLVETPEQALQNWQALQARMGDAPAVPEGQVVSLARRGREKFAVRAGPFAEPAGALTFCVQVRAGGGECWALTPGASALPMMAAVPTARIAPLARATQAVATPAPDATPAPPVAALAPAPASIVPTPVAPSPVALAPAPTAAPAPPTEPARVASGGRVTYAQLAAAGSATAAEGEWLRLRARLGPLLRDREALTVTADLGGRTVWRLRTGPFQASRDAEAFCAEVRSAGGACWAATVNTGS